MRRILAKFLVKRTCVFFIRPQRKGNCFTTWKSSWGQLQHKWFDFSGNAWVDYGILSKINRDYACQVTSNPKLEPTGMIYMRGQPEDYQRWWANTPLIENWRMPLDATWKIQPILFCVLRSTNHHHIAAQVRRHRIGNLELGQCPQVLRVVECLNTRLFVRVGCLYACALRPCWMLYQFYPVTSTMHRWTPRSVTSASPSISVPSWASASPSRPLGAMTVRVEDRLCHRLRQF